MQKETNNTTKEVKVTLNKGYYVDSNNNKYSVQLFNAESAQAASLTMYRLHKVC